jgi:Rrf2 family protein
MKLSTKGRYGIKAMVDLGLEYDEVTVVTLGTLAGLQGISEAYLERIIGSLRSAGLIESVRGAFGGYRLQKAPQNITVGEIIHALEGSTSLLDCVDSGVLRSCGNACSCSARPLWLKLQSRIDEVLNSTTLQDMVDDYMAQIEFLNKKG